MNFVKVGSHGPLSYFPRIIEVVHGFDFSLKAIITGGVWAFADGFISGFVISHLFLNDTHES